MAKSISPNMQKQIQELRSRGFSIRRIAEALRITDRRTVRRYLSNEDPHKIHPSPKPEPTPDECWHQAVDWEKVEQEARRGVPIKTLWQEQAPQTIYVTFWRHLQERMPTSVNPTIVLEHKPAQKVQVDYVDGIEIVNRLTGEIAKTYLFCGVLPFSSYTFGEFVLGQNKQSFLRSHQNMFLFFGGVTPYVVIDNLKAGVTRAHIYDPDVNQAFCELGNHYGFAVLPARPRSPKDKASVESTANVIQRGFYARVRDRVFYSLAELNGAFREYLNQLNHQIMKDYGISRADRFETEKPLLKPLPETPFELADWKFAKVHPDCHIQFEKNFYSVPFSHVGKEVRVRFTDKRVEIFGKDDQETLACHVRLKGIHRYATNMSHYPQPAANVAFYNVDQAKREVAMIGPETKQIVDQLFNNPYPLQYLRRVQGIIRLVKSGRVTKEALEYACKIAKNFKNTRLSYIQQVAVYYQQNGARPVSATPRRSADTVFLHHNQNERNECHGTNQTTYIQAEASGPIRQCGETAPGSHE